MPAAAAPDLAHAEVLPHHVPTATHHPDQCAAHADEQGSPRWVACEDHWMPTDVRKRHDEIRHDAWLAVVRTGRAF